MVLLMAIMVILALFLTVVIFVVSECFRGLRIFINKDSHNSRDNELVHILKEADKVSTCFITPPTDRELAYIVIIILAVFVVRMFISMFVNGITDLEKNVFTFIFVIILIPIIKFIEYVIDGYNEEK